VGAPRTQCLATLAIVLSALLAGCTRTPVPDSPATTRPALGPRQTLLRLMALRGQRLYTDLRLLVVPDRGAEVVATLLAVDDFLDANRRLCEWIRDNAGVGLAETIDQSDLGDALGLFARHGELLDESQDGEEAAVSYVVDTRVPAGRARLRLINYTWRYDPEGGYSDELPAAFHELARGLDHVVAELRTGVLPTEGLHDDPARLVERVRGHLAPGVKLLSRARLAAESGGRERK
jgi:hypothetical protein